jgi:hypothetical protein
VRSQNLFFLKRSQNLLLEPFLDLNRIFSLVVQSESNNGLDGSEASLEFVNNVDYGKISLGLDRGRSGYQSKVCTL